MEFRLLIVLYVFFIRKIDGHSFRNIRTKTDPSTQERAAYGVATRLLGADQVKNFKIQIKEFPSSFRGNDVFSLLKTDINGSAPVEIIGSSGVAATWGLGYYLKKYCGCHVSWDGDQLKLPESFPVVNETVSSIERFKFYQNVCTSSYSFVWWNWTRWEREIDWMALNGINLVYAYVGQEAIWSRVYQGLGLESSDFTGPAFLAWNRMGNMRNFGGGLNERWHRRSLDLQKNILARTRELGIIPVLPAFAGFLPKSFLTKYPDARVTNVSRWNRFPDDECCPYLLSTDDPMFSLIGGAFLREYISEFGTDHVYGADTFNENLPISNEADYLAGTSRAVYDAIRQIDPSAVWLLQGWMFIHPFWGEKEVEAYLSGVPEGRLLILDLQSDLTPQYERLHSYFGRPFIWCTLHNFGGQSGMFGFLEKINRGVARGRGFPNSTMVGIGIVPEGIDTNYVIYEFTLESSNRNHPIELSEWILEYISRRYGPGPIPETLNDAWQTLLNTAYNYTLEKAESIGKKKAFYSHIESNILVKMPSLGLREISWYNKTEMYLVFQKLVAVSKQDENSMRSSELFKHDLVDVTRQTIQFAVSILYQRLVKAFKNKDEPAFSRAGTSLLEILSELDIVLGGGKKFLLGQWLRDAKNAAENNTQDEKQYEFNARNQITLWGSNGEIRDYAAKQWSGLVADYYKPRWGLFVEALNDSLINGTPYNATAVKELIYTSVEKPFGEDRKQYPWQPVGDAFKIIATFHDKWNDVLSELFQ